MRSSPIDVIFNEHNADRRTAVCRKHTHLADQLLKCGSRHLAESPQGTQMCFQTHKVGGGPVGRKHEGTTAAGEVGAKITVGCQAYT